MRSVNHQSTHDLLQRKAGELAMAICEVGKMVVDCRILYDGLRKGDRVKMDYVAMDLMCAHEDMLRMIRVVEQLRDEVNKDVILERQRLYRESMEKGQ